MLKIVKVRDVKPGFMVESVLRPGTFVPCRSVVARNNRIVLSTFESVMRLKPRFVVRVLSVRDPAFESSVAKKVFGLASFIDADVDDDFVPKRARVAAVHELVSVARGLVEVENSERARAGLMSIAKRAGRVDTADDVADLIVATECWLKRYGNLLEFRWEPVRVDDPDSTFSRAWAAMSKHLKDDEDETKDVPIGKKLSRPSCDNCGAPLRRKGPALKRGWGFYRCEYCDAEYSVRES